MGFIKVGPVKVGPIKVGPKNQIFFWKIRFFFENQIFLKIRFYFLPNSSGGAGSTPVQGQYASMRVCKYASTWPKVNLAKRDFLGWGGNMVIWSGNPSGHVWTDRKTAWTHLDRQENRLDMSGQTGSPSGHVWTDRKPVWICLDRQETRLEPPARALF